MSRPGGTLAALKAVPGGARHTPGPQSGGMGSINQVAANAQWGNPYSQNSYGPFLPRPSRVFTDGAFGPMSPIQPVPVDEPPPGGQFPDPRWWQYRTGWNLPTQPGTEGLKLASFDQLYTLANKYSVARACIELRKQEILGLEWQIELTTKAAKAYQGDHKAMRDFGERAAKATRFFKHPDPDFWSFQSFLDALLEEIFVYDALSVIFRPKYGKGLGRGLLGSDLDSMRLVSGPTIRPLLDMHGGKPRPPSPAYQQFLYGVPRSDYQTIITGSDIDDYGLAGAEVNQFRADVMLYAPLVSRRESPYGFPPVERALVPIISGLQKQEFQLDYFTEGTIPGCYISPGDPNMTPTQVKELQDALNGIAGDPAYHLKVIVLPPGSKVEPQRPVDLSDTFDTLVQTQVAMSFDVTPDELGLLPNVGSPGAGGGSNASALRFGAQGARDPKARKSTKPLLLFLGAIFNYVLQDICGQQDMRFSFEGLVDDEDKAAITGLGVEQVQNGIASIDEVRERLDMAPWGLDETSEPVVFTAQGPIPFSMAPQLIAGMQGQGAGGQGTNGGQRSASSRSRTNQPAVRRGGQTKPNGSHPAPVSPHREGATPAHSAAAGAIQSPTPRTGGTTSRSSVAGSRKKAVASELDALARHLRKGRLISTWETRHIPERALGMIAQDIAKGVLIDTAVERVEAICLKEDERQDEPASPRLVLPADSVTKAAAHWPGWERDLGLVGEGKQKISQAFHDAETRGSDLRKKAATGGMFVSNGTLRDLISDEVRDVFGGVLTPLWTSAWHLGYAAAKSLVTGQPADFTVKGGDGHLQAFIGTEGEHWLSSIARTGLGNNSARSELIARTEVARAVNSAAIQCYRDHGITHKHLLLSPGACDICKDAADDGAIALDAPFSAGGVTGTIHPACRCCPGPAGIEAEPPLADLGKSLSRRVNEDGEVVTLTPASQALQAAGARWPYPHRADGAEWPDAGPGAVPGASAGGEPPHWDDNGAEPEPHDSLEPAGDDGEMPTRGRKPNPPADAFPDQGSEHDDAWPPPQTTLEPAGSTVGARTGVPPSGKNDAGHPVVGSVPAKTPAPYKPHSTEPETYDPAEAVEDWSPEAGSDVVHGKGAQHVTDANPVEWRHVYAVMESNFPDSALEWVKHSTWHGPVHVPWSRVDDDDIGSWAAAHQEKAVNRFAKEIARGGKHTAPSILAHPANGSDGREKIIDGHHRALARHFKLRKPVLAYVGTVPARWMKQALETHSSQLHSGKDRANKAADPA